MDYDKSDIAGVYDAARGLSLEGLEQWLGLLAPYVPANAPHIVDLGCGTGRFTQALADRFGARLSAIDPSQKMLDQARKRTTSDRVTFLQAPGEALPLADGSTDVVFMSMVLHHFADVEAVVAQCRRVLRGGGHVCIRSSTRETHFVHEEFFAGFRPIVDKVLLPRSRVTSVFEAAAFQPVVQQLVPTVLAPDWATFADKISLRGDSIIVRLSASDFEAGMAKLRGRAQQHASGPIVEDLDWFVFRK
jgi:ubiquinone/menaquinone biosynthesis C-methylase UbiE